MAKLYNILLSLGQAVFVAYDVTYFQSAGLPLALVLLAGSGFSLTSIVTELPTSILFDRVSPRWTLAIGNIVRASGFVLFVVNPTSFALVVTGELLTGVGSATESGAASALFLNSGRSPNTEKSFERLLNELSEVLGASYIVGGAIGALAYQVDHRLIWLIAAAFYLSATVLLLRIPVKPRPAGGPALVSVRSLLSGFRKTCAKTVTNRNWWLLLSVNTGALSIWILWQVRFSQGLTPAAGAWWQFAGLVAVNLGTTLSGTLGSRWLRQARPPVVLLMLVGNLVLCVIFAFNGGWVGLVAAFAHIGLQTWLANRFSGGLHTGIDDGERATVISLSSLGEALATVVLGPLAGYVAAGFSLPAGMMLSLVFYLVPIMVIARRWLAGGRRHRQRARSVDS